MRFVNHALRAALIIAAIAAPASLPPLAPAPARAASGSSRPFFQERPGPNPGGRHDPIRLIWITGHSAKVQQLIGGSWNVLTCSPPLINNCLDQDWQTGEPLLNKTYTDYQVGGCDEGQSFETNQGDLVFLWGDTLYFKAEDAVAFTRSTDPEAGVALQFFRENDGSTFVVGNHVPFPMTTDDVPEAGISIGGDNYVVCSTGYDNTGKTDPPYLNKHSVLTHFTAGSQLGTWDIGRTISTNANGGHFVEESLVQRGDENFMFGTGGDHDSDIYLAEIPAKHNERFPKNNFWTAKQPTKYFIGLLKARQGRPPIPVPSWTTNETDPRVMPVVVDNPIVNGQPLNLGPTAKKVSVQYEPDLHLWLMTYDGGKQQQDIGDPNHVMGIYFSYARQPWGPWSQPQLIYNPARDGGYGSYINNPDPSINPKNPFATTAPTGGPQGPTIGDNDPCKDPGHVYAPFMIPRFNRIDKAGKTLSLYYTMSTWNPYTPLLMRSDFSIEH